MKKSILIRCLIPILLTLCTISCKSTKYISIPESKESDKAIISLLYEAPTFPSLITTPTEFGWFQISDTSLRNLADFKLNLYPEYTKTVNIVLEDLVK